jgi:hypothetical protein
LKRGPFEVLRRGLEDTLANWPLILIRLIETIVFFAIAIATAMVIIAPILVSLGIDFADIEAAASIEEVLAAFSGKWVMLGWIFLGITVALVLFVAIHSLVEAGSARVYVDAERIAGTEEGSMARFHVFSFDRWFAGARDGWWTVFWIYNFAWGLAGMILLIPIAPTAAVVAMFGRNNPGVAIGIGCLGLAVSLFVMFLVTLFTSIWANRAIVEWAVHRTGAAASLGAARRAFRADLGRHILIAIALFVLAIAGSAFFSTFSLFAGIGEIVGRNSSTTFMMTLPLRIIGTVLSSAFSAGVTSWFLASYAALAAETTHPPSS